MPKEFKYDILKLIDSVRERPCLWDKLCDNYKDRMERKVAWEEIFCILDASYETMTPVDKRVIGELIVNKWTNLRDTFVKTLKTKMGKPKKKYVYHDQLKFLIKMLGSEDDTYNYTANDDISFNDCKNEESEEEIEAVVENEEKRRSKKRSKINHDEEYEPTKKSIKTYKTSYDECEAGSSMHTITDYPLVEGNEDQRLMNEDEAFFASLLPTIVKYNEDERLEFRIEVLSIMKRIKQNRKMMDIR